MPQRTADATLTAAIFPSVRRGADWPQATIMKTWPSHVMPQQRARVRLQQTCMWCRRQTAAACWHLSLDSWQFRQLRVGCTCLAAGQQQTYGHELCQPCVRPPWLRCLHDCTPQQLASRPATCTHGSPCNLPYVHVGCVHSVSLLSQPLPGQPLAWPSCLPHPTMKPWLSAAWWDSLKHPALLTLARPPAYTPQPTLRH